MGYLARPITRDGHPRACDTSQIVTRVATYHDGVRIRHWAGQNSAKVYNEQNVIRVETTINDPSAFRVMRKPQNARAKEPKRRMSMRKGIADIAHCAAVSQGINNRVMDNLASLTDATPLADLIAPYTRGFTKDGRWPQGLSA